MQRVLERDWGYRIATFKKRTVAGRKNIARGKTNSRNAGSVKIDFKTGAVFLAVGAFLLGVLYLYQVNGIATKGYEVREIENRIQDSSKEKNNLEIKEVELRSMYNIEKSMKGLNLVNSPGISYIEMESPVAMK